MEGSYLKKCLQPYMCCQNIRSSLILFCSESFSIVTKLNAKMVHIPHLSNGLSRFTALFYFDNDKDINQALALKNSLYY